MSIINIPTAIGVINGFNECANLFQWVKSAISSLQSQWNGTQKEQLQENLTKLQRDLQRLGDTLPAMYNLIDRAEWKIHDGFVADLLPRLKDAVYDADNLLDEFRWYELKVKIEGKATSMEPIVNYLSSFSQGSFNRVVDIQDRLNNLSSQLEKFGLHQATPRFDKSVRPETTSFPTEAKIFGRDKETNELIRLLGVPANNRRVSSRQKKQKTGAGSSSSSQVYASPENNESTITSVPVLAIVGIGGVGKTTLAQNICNHPKVKSHFDMIIWICVSDGFDVKRLTNEVLQSLSSNKESATENLDSLQRALSGLVNSKRFLLILDDMWDDALKEDGKCWKRFCAPFTKVLQGSMILVTTRIPKVADLVCTIDPFPLDGLKDDVFWDFFRQCVFGSDRSSNNDPELNRIGMEILPKLRGSPLAAKTLGRLLGMSLDPAHWDRILRSQLWELRQEETDILPALRLSYMYLPFRLKRCFSICAVYPKDYRFEKEDLAEIWVAEGFVERQPNIPLRYVGCRYFEELVNLSFLQEFRGKYVIHDLMHDMAQLVSKEECFIIKDTEDLKKIPENIHHVSVLKSGDVKCSDLLHLCKHRKLRTILCNMSLKTKTGNTVMENWCTELLCMRVMTCASISKWGLPGSIGNMKHLRYLKILDSCLSESLPATLCYLYNLQILYANKWVINNIPSGFCMLFNLQKFQSSTYQFHHEHSGHSREGASDKGQKRKFQFLVYHGESVPSGFHPQNLSNITSLHFQYCTEVKSISFSMNPEQIHSHHSIGSTFSSLTDVDISFCQNLSSLEQFLQPAYAPIIRHITIAHCQSLELVPTERFGDFAYLEELSVSHCPKISSRCLFAPSLKQLFLHNCGNLGDTIDCTSLTSFNLEHYPAASIELQKWNLPMLQKLMIVHCLSLTVIRDSEPISTDLFLGGASSSSTGGKFPRLTHLNIRWCWNLKIIDDLLCLPAIESIRFDGCGLLSLPTKRFGSFSLLKDLTIEHCQGLNWQSGMFFPSSLQVLNLGNCGDFSAWFPTCLENLTSLVSLAIYDCGFIVSVPGHLWSSSLKSLQSLRFEDCPELVSVGGPNATANIRYVVIQGCPKFEEPNQSRRRS